MEEGIFFYPLIDKSDQPLSNFYKFDNFQNIFLFPNANQATGKF